mmetsp:Transcript_672/g.736  ORF Transcript_672/g.736 Transcript_672/m.736 type:complete len:158 (-) Transcript_672:288-761(-)|eukprot:CAMPEP_0198267276 /NCGR_PEP_ID=MMETSP1447-20131203/32319_1 /TAXON_ID=420782 /ORGANISM="Chaetoceros dichaeta, Strain CCMP1751" /LENGTH=157 /DNA_ID=CAMNT_0043957793 /DNA_START=284 /DNA_END=757 /DNA_ORIENTATION=+
MNPQVIEHSNTTTSPTLSSPPPHQHQPEAEDEEGKIVVHGMLTASLFSAIFGTLIPGSIYRSQKLNFRSLVYCNEPIVGRVYVTKVRNMKGRGALVACDTSILRRRGGGRRRSFLEEQGDFLIGGDGEGGGVCREDMEECIVGEAEVWLPGIVGVEG